MGACRLADPKITLASLASLFVGTALATLDPEDRTPFSGGKPGR